MKLLAPLTLLAATVAANPIVSRQDQDGSSSKTFTLKTTNAQNPQHDNLYVWAYHTGAGLNDAVLGDAEKASPGSLNGTNVNFELGSAFPWGMFMPGAANYAGTPLPLPFPTRFSLSSVYLEAKLTIDTSLGTRAHQRRSRNQGLLRERREAGVG